MSLHRTDEKFGVALSRVMEQRKVGMSALGRTVGKDRRTVANWMDGLYLPDTPTAYRIAEALGDVRLYQMVVRRREGKCRYCASTTVAISNRPRVWCNATCRDRFRNNRTPRQSVEQVAINRMCRRCEPDGACYTADCPLRDWSPLPLVDDEVLPMAPTGTWRRRAA